MAISKQICQFLKQFLKQFTLGYESWVYLLFFIFDVASPLTQLPLMLSSDVYKLG